jgi:hypothetical protein
MLYSLKASWIREEAVALAADGYRFQAGFHQSGNGAKRLKTGHF